MKAILLLFVQFILINTIVFGQFIENKGQILDSDQNFHPEVKYYASSGNSSAYFLNNKVVYNFREIDKIDFSKTVYKDNVALQDSIKGTLGSTHYRIDLEFLNANFDARIKPEEKSNHSTNYFLNKRENIQGVQSFSKITYGDIYPNIDLVFYESKKGIKYDFIINEGGRIEDIELRYAGAEEVYINENGELTIKTDFGNLTETIPVSFINKDIENTIKVNYKVDAKGIISYGVENKNYQHLTIDPFLTWATYFEGPIGDGGLDYYSTTADDQGNFFIEGWINNAANDYPTVDPGGSAYLQNYISNNLYIAKFDVNRALVWATYYGGSTAIDWALGTQPMVVGGNILHIIGSQLSTDAPLLNGGGYYNGAPSSDPYWLRFNKNTGELLHATSIPGHTSSNPSIAVSSSGLVAIIQEAYDFSNPVIMNRAGAYNQPINGGYVDMHLMLLNSSFNVIWGTFLGGPNTTDNFHVAFDSNDNIFFVGEANSTFSPTPANTHLVNYPGSYYQSSYTGLGNHDLIIGKFTSSGALVWHTLYGGDSSDGLKSQMGNGSRVIIDPSNNDLIVIGGTNSSNFPVQNLAGAYNKSTPPANNNPSSGSYWDFNSFILKFNNNGVRNWATYWGDDAGGDLLYDGKFVGCDKFIVSSRSTDHITLPLPYGFNQATGLQTFLMQFNSSFSAEWSSYIGAGGNPSIAFSSFDNRLYVGASTYDMGITMVDPGGGAYFDSTNDDPDVTTSSPAFSIFELNLNPQITGDNTVCVGSTIMLIGGGTPAASNPWTSSNPSVATVNNSGVVTGVSVGNTTITFTDDSGCSSDYDITVGTQPTASATVTSNNICAGDDIELNANTVSGASYSWTGPNGYSSNAEDPTISGATASESGVYELIISIGSCSSTLSSVTITVNPPPSLTITGNDITCNGDGDGQSTVVPTGNGPFSYSWSPSGGTAATATGLSAGTYTVTVIDDNSCEETTNFTINEPSVISLSSSSTDSQCTVDDGTATVVASGGNGGFTYLWTPTGQTTATATGVGAGSYSVEVTDTEGCTANETVIVNSINGPLVTINNIQSANCSYSSDGSAEAIVTGGTPNYSYNWSLSGETNAVANNLSAGNHTVTVTDGAGCIGTQTVTISAPSPIAIANTLAYAASCGESNGSISITPNGGTPSYTYNWTTGETTSTLTGVAAGNYSITITDDHGCILDTAFNIPSAGSFTIEALPEEATIESGGTIGLTVNIGAGVSGETYTWTPTNGLSCTNCPNPDASPNTSTTYYVTVETPDGCSSTDSVYIKVENGCRDLFIPNMFSPNSDGENDEFCVYGDCITAYEISIFNRWGEVVYTSDNQNDCWDGTYKGKKMNTGVFVYKLSFTSKQGEQIEESGNINLIR